MLVDKIVAEAGMRPIPKAYFLLLLARSCLSGLSYTELEEQYGQVLEGSAGSYFRRKLRRFKEALLTSANQVAGQEFQSEIDSIALSKEQAELASEALQQALILLDNSEKIFARIHMLFIVSRLFKELNDFEGMRRCDAYIEAAVKATEEDDSASEEAIDAVISLFDVLAYGLIPLRIADHELGQIKLDDATKSSTADRFVDAEALKLRGMVLADRLDMDSHVRRKAQRDLALWYQELGKVELAERQKERLFDLIGVRNDRLLFPQSGACGSLVWWSEEPVQINVRCGKG